MASVRSSLARRLGVGELEGVTSPRSEGLADLMLDATFKSDTSLDVLAQVERTLAKARFWQHFRAAGLLPEQVKVLNRLLDGGERGFEYGLSASQYQKVAKVSKATATHHLAGLVEKSCLMKLPGGGRSTRYQVPERLPQDGGEQASPMTKLSMSRSYCPGK